MNKGLLAKIGIPAAIAFGALGFIGPREGEVEIREGQYQGKYNVESKGIVSTTIDKVKYVIFDSDSDGKPDKLNRFETIDGGLLLQGSPCSPEQAKLYVEVMKKRDEQKPMWVSPLTGLKYALF